MTTNNECPACQQPVLPTQNDPLGHNQDSGVAISMRRDAAGEDVAQRWHVGCRQAEGRRSQRRHGHAADPALLDDVREALR